jgi:hypothetical protein
MPRLTSTKNVNQVFAAITDENEQIRSGSSKSPNTPGNLKYFLHPSLSIRNHRKGAELMYDDISVTDELDHVADNPSRFSKAEMSGMMKVAAATIRLQRQRLKEAEAIILDDLVPEGHA